MTGRTMRVFAFCAQAARDTRSIALAAALSISFVSPSPAVAQLYNPLAERERAVRVETPKSFNREELPPSAPLEERTRGVEREDLDPVLAADGSGLPHEVWGGLSAEDLAQHVSSLKLPPRSPALQALWRRLITSDTSAVSGADTPARFTAMRIEILDQSGFVSEAAAMLAKDAATQREPLLMALAARSEIGIGNTERGCDLSQRLVALRPQLPKPIQADSILVDGYCAAARGDMEGAALRAGLLRELDLPGFAGADILDAVAAGLAPEAPAGVKLSLVDYRIGALKRGLETRALVQGATPALLAGVANDPRASPDVRLAAGEAAAAINAIPARDLAALYRLDGAGSEAGTIERAGLFKQAESERTPLKKARLIRAFIDEARPAGLYRAALELMAPATDALAPVPEIGWFSETAIEVYLASGHYEGARSWARFMGTQDAINPAHTHPLSHWVALADIVDPARAADRGRSLASVETMALDGRFDPALLHRLATVLDALDVSVPMPLWELASRTPQPAGGHLPDTGTLSALVDASRKKELGKTVLLVMRTLGPEGAEGAHMIALGDCIRALKRAGLESEARQIAFEGLFPGWPRQVSQ